MEVSMTQAALSAALSVFVGIALGAVYDVIRFLRVLLGVDVANPFKKKKRCAIARYIIVALGDFLFFAIAAFTMSVFFFLTGDGRMRGYALIGAFLGFSLYYHTLGRLFIGVSAYLVALCKKGIRVVWHFMGVPFVKLFGILKRITLRIFNLPIVTATIKRYNEYISKRKKKALERARKRKMLKGGYCCNGGAHGEVKSK